MQQRSPLDAVLARFRAGAPVFNALREYRQDIAMLVAQCVVLFDLRKRAGRAAVSFTSGHKNDNLVHFYVSLCDLSIEEISCLRRLCSSRQYAALPRAALHPLTR